MTALLTLLLAAASGVAWVPITIYLIKNPEKIQSWASMFAWVLSKIWKNSEYFAIKHGIESKVNSFVSELNNNIAVPFPKISIQWTGKKDEELIWSDGEVILVMRDREHKSKNIVHASYFFVSEVLLKKSKIHLSKTQKISLDLYATQKILEKKAGSYAEQFSSSYFIPEIQRDTHGKLKTYVGKITNLDRTGLFFPVLIQELNHLGNKVLLSNPDQQIIKEVDSLIDFLETFSEREVGDVTTPDCFQGKYLRCSIRIVASWQSRENNKVDAHKTRIKEIVDRGFEDIYIIGDGSISNRLFISRVIKAVIEENQDVEQIKSYRFDSLIKRHGKRVKVNTSLTHLKNPTAVKYIYSKEDLDKNTVEAVYENTPSN